MKILQINNFHRFHGGSDKVYLETAQLLKAKGHEVQFFSTKSEKNESTEYNKYFVDDINYHELKNISDKFKATVRFINNKKASRNLEKLVKEQKPDIAHLHVFQGRLSSAILGVLKNNKIPIVFSIHEYKILCPVYTFLDNKNSICEACQGKYFYNCLIKKCNNNSFSYSFISTVESYLRNSLYPIERYGEHFIMVSNFIYNKHIQYKPLMASKSTMLYNFNNLENHTNQIKIRGDYFLYFGRLSYEKGLITLLKAFVEKPDLNLKIVGSGPMENEMQQFIKANGMQNVELIGYKKGKELNDFISNASFTIVPSEWYESFGLTVIESMALGTPVIASNIGALPELVKENESGFLFQHKNHQDLISKLDIAYNTSEVEYASLSRNSREFAEGNFKKDAYYQKLIIIYQNSIRSYNEKT